ncbi:complement factor B [Arapaima gigas]
MMMENCHMAAGCCLQACAGLAAFRLQASVFNSTPSIGLNPTPLVTCPDPLVFEYGSVSPTQLRYYVNNQTTYECFDGSKFVGSVTRVCQPNGKWSGSTPICDRSSAVCPDPGVPAGSRRGGNSFDIDDKVTYCCDHDMVIVGSSERVCQESGEWTGTEPACYCELLNTNRTTRTQ